METGDYTLRVKRNGNRRNISVEGEGKVFRQGKKPLSMCPKGDKQLKKKIPIN